MGRALGRVCRLLAPALLPQVGIVPVSEFPRTGAIGIRGTEAHAALLGVIGAGDPDLLSRCHRIEMDGCTSGRMDE